MNLPKARKRVFDAFFRQIGKKIELKSVRPLDDQGNSYVLEYTTKHGGRGKLELYGLGPTP